MAAIRPDDCVAPQARRTHADESSGAATSRGLEVVLGLRHDERSWVIRCHIDDADAGEGGLREALVSGCVLSLVQVEECTPTESAATFATNAAELAEMQRRLDGLSRAERRVLDLLADGLSNRQIADRLFLAHKTVKNYMSSLLYKLDMSRRTEAAVFAARLRDHGSVPRPEVTRAAREFQSDPRRNLGG